MQEAHNKLPLHDTIEALRSAFMVRLTQPNLENRHHVQMLLMLDEESARAGQVDPFSNKVAPMSDENRAALAMGKMGKFSLIEKLLMRGTRVVGQAFETADTHIAQTNEKLAAAGSTMRLEESSHIEVSTFILPGVHDREEVDDEASLLQLIDLFHLDGNGVAQVQTAAMYMDDVDADDRTMAARIGFGVSVDGILYQEDNTVNTAFIATPESVTAAVYAFARRFGISTAPSGARNK